MGTTGRMWSIGIVFPSARNQIPDFIGVVFDFPPHFGLHVIGRRNAGNRDCPIADLVIIVIEIFLNVMVLKSAGQLRMIPAQLATIPQTAEDHRYDPRKKVV